MQGVECVKITKQSIDRFWRNQRTLLMQRFAKARELSRRRPASVSQKT